MKIPARYTSYVFAFCMSGLMSLLMSGVLTIVNLGPVPDFARLWVQGWLLAWGVAFPCVVVVMPVVRRLVRLLVENPD